MDIHGKDEYTAMLILTKEQERILKHIISLPKNGRNAVSIGNQMTTCPENIDDKKLIQILTYLEQINFIKIKWMNYFSSICT